MSGQKFSLSFTKTIEKKNLQPSAIRNDAPKDEKINTEALESIEENVMKTDGKQEEQELVIPMVVADRLSILRKIAEKRLQYENKDQDDEEPSSSKTKENEEVSEEIPKVLTLDEQAEAAIIEESRKKLDDWTDRGTTNSNLAISHTEEENENEKGAPAGKESSLDDYDEVEVSVFGAALLRGMGWQKTEGLGRVNKRVVEVIDPSSKTFGLANTLNESGKKTGEGNAVNQEELVLAKGSFVFIHSGRRRGTYGIAESIDEDHLLVKSAVGQEVIREVELNIRVVSQKEYKDSSRVINKNMYDKFKEEEARKKNKNKNRPSKNSDDSEDEVKGIKKEDLPSKNLQKREKAEVEKRIETTVPLKVKTESAEREELKDPVKHFKSDRVKTDVKDEQDDVLIIDEVRPTEKEKASDRVREQSKSSKYEKYEERYRSEEKVRYEGKPDRSEEKVRYEEKPNRSKDKYKSSSHDKYASNSRHFGDKHRDKYNSNSGEKYGKKYKKREVESNVYDEEFKKAKKSQEQMPAMPWVRENLRVRLINRDYKGGRYHKEKVIVKIVETAESCECITEEGKTLREVHPGWLETVIPKAGPQIIWIVKGNQKGQRGRILQLHKDQEKASVQLFEDNTVILKLHYDDICEYVSH